MPELSVMSWNVYVKNDPANVRRHIRAIKALRNPEVIGLTEAAHMWGRLDGLGYDVYQARRRPSRHRGWISEASNSALLIRHDVKTKRRVMLRLRLAWKGPKLGKMHDPRQFPWALVGWDGKTWKTAPALHWPFGGKQTDEADKALRGWFRRTFLGRPTFAAGDMQKRGPEIRRRIGRPVGATVAGQGIDLGIARNCTIVRVENMDAGGSDHPAMLYTLRAGK